MKPTLTISSKHITLILGIVVALIVIALMMLRSPEVKLALYGVFPTLALDSPDTQISELKIALMRAAEIVL